MMMKDNVYSQIEPGLYCNNGKIPPVPIGGNFTYLGKVFDFNMQNEPAKSMILNKLKLWSMLRQDWKSDPSWSWRYSIYSFTHNWPLNSDYTTLDQLGLLNIWTPYRRILFENVWIFQWAAVWRNYLFYPRLEGTGYTILREYFWQSLAPEEELLEKEQPYGDSAILVGFFC